MGPTVSADACTACVDTSISSSVSEALSFSTFHTHQMSLLETMTRPQRRVLTSSCDVRRGQLGPLCPLHQATSRNKACSAFDREKTWQSGGRYFAKQPAWENQVFFHGLRKLGFSRADKYKKSRVEGRKQNCILSNRCDFFFSLHLANLILAWNSTKSTPLNWHYPKLQFSTYTWFSHAQSHLKNGHRGIIWTLPF